MSYHFLLQQNKKKKNKKQKTAMYPGYRIQAKGMTKNKSCEVSVPGNQFKLK